MVPPKLKRLVEICWSADYESRPEFIEIIESLEEVSREIKPDLMDVKQTSRPASAAPSSSVQKKDAVPPVADSGGCCTLM